MVDKWSVTNVDPIFVDESRQGYSCTKNEETLESHFVNQTDKLSNIRIENHGRLVKEGKTRSGLSPTWIFLLQALRVGCVVIALGYKNCPLAASALQFSSTIKKTSMALERQVRMKLAGKRNAEQEKEAQEWIESIIGKKFPQGELFEDVLKDGQVLCHLMNKISPGSIPKINTSGGQFKMMENINVFQKALKDYGVPDVDVFQTVDLYEKKDIAQVTTTLFALGRETYRHPEWKGPYLGPKPADECKREFSEETLRAGESVIGLQAGSNKGATQAGQNMGASRKILMGK